MASVPFEYLLAEQAQAYSNEVTVESSIPLLQRVGVLQCMVSVADAKQRMESNTHSRRLVSEARFVYALWNMLDEQAPLDHLKDTLLRLHRHAYASLPPDLVACWKTLGRGKAHSNKKPLSREGKENSNVVTNEQSTKVVQRCNGKNAFVGNRTLNEKQLVGRLYERDKYKEREMKFREEELVKRERELAECTFKPLLLTRGRSRSKSQQSLVKGYEKAVSRLRVGQQKTRILKEKKQYIPAGENYEKIKDMKIEPPKFLMRKKVCESVLFIIQFDLGRHKVKVKVHQEDTDQGIALNLCKIYSLKQEQYAQIKCIIQKQRQAYYLQAK